jgi:hypothetical protein
VLQVVAGRPATVRVVFYDADGAPADADGQVTADVTSDDGTALVSGRVCASEGAGVYALTLTPAETATLDLLTVTAAGQVGGVDQEPTGQVEVAGGIYFTVAEARRTKPLQKTDTYSDADIEAARIGAERDLEHCEATNQTFVPRYRREIVRPHGSRRVWLDRARPRRIRSLAVDGVELTADEIAALDLFDFGLVKLDRRATHVEVAYEYGWDSPPRRMVEAALLLTKQYVIDSQIDDRALRVIDPEGRETVYSAPGVRGILFSIPEVEGAVRQFRLERAFM